MERITLKKAALRLGYTKPWVLNLIRRGVLPARLEKDAPVPYWTLLLRDVDAFKANYRPEMGRPKGTTE